MTIIAIVYYSGYGHTAKQAEAIHQGAASHPGTTATLYRIDANGELPAESWDAISSAAGIIYGGLAPDCRRPIPKPMGQPM